MVLVIMVDSLCNAVLQPDIMPFLYSKTNHNAHNISLIPPFGFFSEYTWFTGKTHNEFPGGFVFQKKVNEETSSYCYPNIIPSKYKRYFQQSRQVFYPNDLSIENIYSQINNKKYISINWPNLLPLEKITSFIKEKPINDAQFVYLQIFELDKIAHKYGINANPTKELASKIDSTVKEIVDFINTQIDCLDMIIFGDHGFINVEESYDIIENLEKCALEWGKDALYFIDSTIARFWNNRLDVNDLVKYLNAQIPNSKLFTFRDLKYEDNRFGDYYLLLPPKYVFFPSFLGSRSQRPAGMHGYLDLTNNNSRMIISGSYREHLIGDYLLEMHQLYYIIKFFLNGNIDNKQIITLLDSFRNPLFSQKVQ